MSNQTQVLSRKLLIIISITSGITVANIYYVQPLLNEIAEYFSISLSRSGLMVTLTQIGYACGLLFILPVADIWNKKKLVITLLIFSVIALVGIIFSKTFYAALFFCIILGVSSIIPQLMIPLGAQLSREQDRGGNIGIIMGGLMSGALLSRTLSGLLSNLWGWKTVYIFATALIIVLTMVLSKVLPDITGFGKMKYRESFLSLFSLPSKYPVLARAAVNGALIFFVFSGFLTVLTFHLSGVPFGYEAGTIGLFGLLGVAGVLLSPAAGKLTDKKGAEFTVCFHIVVMLAAVIVLGVFRDCLWGIITGTVLMNYSSQCCNVANQGRIQCLSDMERNRITAVYMVTFFLGGALGTFVAASIYEQFQWNGFISMAFVIIAAALLLHLKGKQRSADPIS